MGICNIDVEVTEPETGLALIREVLRSLGVAKTTIINQYEPSKARHAVYKD
jgi:hypothetical protein